MKRSRNQDSPKTSSLLLVPVSKCSSNVFFFFFPGPVDRDGSGLGALEANELDGSTEEARDKLRGRFWP